MTNSARLLLLAAPLALLPCLAAGDADGWVLLKADQYRLYHQPTYAKDAAKVKRFLGEGIAGLKKEFSSFPVDDLLKVDCKVYLHPKPTAKASESTASILTGGFGAGYHAEIHLLTPSAYGPAYRTNVGEPAGDDQYFKLVVHEYSTVLLDRVTQSKKKGWRFFDAPRWFVDGYEEYLGLTLTSERNRKDLVGRYLAAHKADPDRIDFDFGISVRDPYVDGSLLLLFMNEEFGRAKVQAILTSEERRFGRAVTASLGVGLGEFARRWEAWLKKRMK